MSKIRSIFTSGICIVLFATLLFSNIILAQDGGSYDPWIDTNDDGIIDAIDLQALASIYSTSGKPINKTALLLELETRLDILNDTLFKYYYNTTECDSLFALLSHLHSASDISGGTLAVDQIQIGSSETDQTIYFYDDGSEFGEYIHWNDSDDRFGMSDDIYIDGTINMPETTRYYSIPACAWQPESSDYDFFIVGGGGALHCIYTNTPGSREWYAPVNLPHGAVVTEFNVRIRDDDPSENVNVQLYRSPDFGATQEMASVSTSGSSAGFIPYVDSSIDYATVNNEWYCYLLRGVLSSGSYDHALGLVRITYTITEPLP